MSDARVTGDVTLAQIVPANSFRMAAPERFQRRSGSPEHVFAWPVSKAHPASVVTSEQVAGGVASQQQNVMPHNERTVDGGEQCLTKFRAEGFHTYLRNRVTAVRRIGDADPAEFTVSDGRAVRDA